MKNTAKRKILHCLHATILMLPTMYPRLFHRLSRDTPEIFVIRLNFFFCRRLGLILPLFFFVFVYVAFSRVKRTVSESFMFFTVKIILWWKNRGCNRLDFFSFITVTLTVRARLLFVTSFLISCLKISTSKMHPVSLNNTVA